jgi:phage terminase large subunit-like protein
MIRVEDNFKRAQLDGWEHLIVTESDREAVRQGCYVDFACANRVDKFFTKFLRHYKGDFKGRPFILLPWERERVVLPVYGWKLPNGKRRIRKVFLTMAKKNGKTGLGAGLANYHLVADGEGGPKCYLTANAEEQAGNSFDDCAKMVKKSPQLAAKLIVTPSTYRIVFDQANGFLTAIPSNAEAAEGIDASFTLTDEIHMAATREMFDVLQFAGDGRSQPLWLITTTAGDGNDTESIGFEEYTYAKKVLSGEVIDIGYLAVIFEAEPTDDIRDPATWRKANPSMGVTINEERFKQELEEALTSAARLTNFKRRKLNMWVGSPKHFIPRDKWDACKGAFPDELSTVQAEIGLDLGDNSDLTAAVELREYKGKIYVRANFWCPEETVSLRISEGRVPYRDWVDRNLITSTDGASTDFAIIEEHLVARCETGQIKEVSYDPYQALNLISTLTGKRIPCAKVPQQVPHIAPAMGELERRVLNKTIVHDGNPVLAWMIANIEPTIDNKGNYMPKKGKKSKKIDGASALLTALSRVMVAPPKKESVYKRRGIVTF